MTEQALVPTQEMGFTSASAFDLIQRAGKLLASSSLVPDEYKNNIPNCCLALNMARRLGADPLMVMQSLFLVHGRPAWSAAFLIGAFNSCGRYTSLKYRFVGTKGKDDYGCMAMCQERATGEVIEGATVTIGMAREEGWLEKKGSKWKSMADQMLRYRAATFLIRATAPELAMGLHTADEVDDFAPARPIRNVTPESLTSGATVTGEDMSTHGERRDLLARLEAERVRIGLDLVEWNAAVRDAIGEGPLDAADQASLSDFLAELRPMAPKR